jgi:hypothetical protein
VEPPEEEGGGVTIYCGRGSTIKLPDSLSISRNGVVWSETIYLESQKEIHPSPCPLPPVRGEGEKKQRHSEGNALPQLVGTPEG